VTRRARSDAAKDNSKIIISQDFAPFADRRAAPRSRSVFRFRTRCAIELWEANVAESLGRERQIGSEGCAFLQRFGAAP
jgi:hypothetical protein